MNQSFEERWTNTFNSFMVLYFKFGYSYEVAHEKALKSTENVFSSAIQPTV